jgi:hypothetical protein
MTLIDPVIVSVLREGGKDAAYAEMEGSTSGSWTFQQITSLVPRLRLENGRGALRYHDACGVGRIAATDYHPDRSKRRALHRAPSRVDSVPRFTQRQSWFPARHT